jgi:3-hydroxyacyl-CoA dehydrogenase
MPPHQLLSLVGPAIALHNVETLHRAFPDRFYVSPTLARVVAAKKPGYYAADGTIDPEVEALLERPEEPVLLTQEEVRTRVLSGLAEEARLMLDEGVVVGPEDLDLAMITGAGFSFWNGGLTMLLEREGLGKFH